MQIDLVTEYGYTSESHRIITEDGYILTGHRLLEFQEPADKVTKPLVILVHGILSSSEVWVQRGRDKDIGNFIKKDF